MSYQTILFEQSPDGVATITLNRPEVMNAFDRQMGADFVDAWRRVRESPEILAVVLRAAGDRAFCTGSDTKKGGWARSGENPFEAEDPGSSLGPKQNRVWKPVVCAVHGLCAGGAFYWLNESDIVICSDEAHFFDPHTTYGRVCAVEPIGMLPRVPYGEVMRMVLMGNDERICADTALRIGLVSEITSREALWARAHEIASGIAAKPAAAIQGSIKAIWESLDMPRAVAVANALKYCQLGNPIGRAQVDRASMPKAKWKLR